MLAMLMEARSRTSDWQYAHVGEMLFNFFMAICHLNPQEYIRLWHDANGKLIGYAMLGEDPSFDYQILPEYEWRGIELEALDWAETRLVELRKNDPQRWSGNLVSGARQDNAMRIAFLEQNGFRYCGEFAEVNMIRSLDEPMPALQSWLPDFKSASSQKREKSQIGPLPSARSGIRGALARSATRIMRASCNCPATIVNSMLLP
jgi:hypothetical protein